MKRAVLLLLTLLAVPSAGEAFQAVAPKADALVIQVAEKGTFDVPGRKEPLPTPAALRTYLKEQFAANKGPKAIVLRADKNALVDSLYLAAQQAQAAEHSPITVEANGQTALILPHWKKPESLADHTVHVKSIRDGVNEGKVAAIAVKNGAEETSVANVGALTKLLKERRAAAKVANPDTIAIAAETDVKFGPLLEVVTACKTAGFPAVAFAVPPDVGPEPPPLTKLAPPDAAAQAQTDKDIKAYYKELYAQPAVAELARRLRQASDYCSDPNAKFVLLRESADAAARAGDVPGSLDALDQLSKEYRFDAWAPKLEKFKTAPNTKPVVEAALREAGSASLQGRLDYSIRFLKVADNAAKASKSPELIQYVEERRRTFKLPKVDELDPFAPLPSGAPIDRSTKPKAEAKAPVASDDGDDASSQFQNMILLFGVPALLILLVGGGALAMWLRKGDSAVRNRIAEARKGQFEMPGDDAPPAPEPPA